MPFGDYLTGVAFLGGTLLCVCAATTLVVRGRYGHLPPVARAVAWGTLALCGLIGVHVVPLMLSVLSRGTVLLTAALALAAAWRWGGDRAADVEREPAPGQPSGVASRVVAGATVLAVTGWVAGFLVEHARDPIATSDAMNFLLPQVGRWIQSGSLWQIDNFVPGWAFGNYPGSGNILQLATVLPFHSDAFVRFAAAPPLVLMALATYAAATQLAAPRATAAVLAAVICSIPTVYAVLHYAIVDALTFAGIAVALLFLLRHATTGRRSELVLAGLGLGLALGTKWYGVPAAVLLAIAWAAGSLLARRGLGRTARDGALLAGVAAAMGGIWLLRNLILSGNPFFPAKVDPLGITLFDAPPDPIRDQIGWSIAHYLRPFDSDAIDIMLPRLRDAFGWGAPALAAGALAAFVAAAAAVRRRTPGSAVALVVCATALGLGLLYVLTPYTAQGLEGNPRVAGSAARYALPALIVAAVATGWLAGRLARLRLPVELAGAALVLAGLGNADKIHLSSFDALTAGSLLSIAAVLAGGVVLVAVVRGAARQPSAARVGAAAALVAIALAGGFRLADDFQNGRFQGVNRVYDALYRHAPEGHRIGLAGLWSTATYQPPWVAFGPRVGNHVAYVGPSIRERLARYRRPGPFREALRRGGYDYLLVAQPPALHNPEAGWAIGAGWRVVSRGGDYLLLIPPG